MTTKWDLRPKKDVDGTTGEIRMCNIVKSIALILVRGVGKKRLWELSALVMQILPGDSKLISK